MINYLFDKIMGALKPVEPITKNTGILDPEYAEKEKKHQELLDLIFTSNEESNEDYACPDEDEYERCNWCEGEGYVWDEDGEYEHECENCGGEGIVYL